MEKLEKIVIFKPAFDRRNDDPKKNYGIHSVQCWMVLKGEKGAVTFTFSTGMYLPETMREYAHKGKLNAEVGNYSDGYFHLNKPMGYDVGYHSHSARYDGQLSRPDCEFLDGKTCFYDGSALQAEKFMDILIKRGSDKIWEELEKEYISLFK